MKNNTFSDGCYFRFRGTCIRAGQNWQNYRSSAAIRCFLVLPGSRYRNDEMRSCQCPACRWWQHEGYRCGPSDARISGNSFEGWQNLQVMKWRRQDRGGSIGPTKPPTHP